MGNILYTSDLHFGHFRIIEYCNRPFKTAAEMDGVLIKNWNNKVKPEDTVYVLGDLAFHHSTTEIVDILLRLNGTIIYVLGNHDGETVKSALDTLNIPYTQMLDIVVTDPEMEGGRQAITLCHYPMISWNKARRGAWQLYGHHHGSKKDFADKLTYAQLDVSVEAHNYAPVSYEEVKTIITKQYMGTDIKK